MIEENSKSQNQPKKNEQTEEEEIKGNQNNLNGNESRIEINDDTQLSAKISKVKGFRYTPTIEIILFSLLTCGFYGYYLTYKQVEVIRRIDKSSNGLFEPILVVLLIIFSCGLGGIYFHYKIPERASYLSRKSGGSSNKARKDLRPPLTDLAMISLAANGFWVIFFLIVTVASAGILTFLFYPIYIVFWIWLTYSIQRSVEYMLGIKSPIEQ
tara:strand:- start:103 stop:738 length:636 start_codon:yes stop_codon:yes gene_type:complete